MEKPKIKFKDCEKLLCPSLRYSRGWKNPNGGNNIHNSFIGYFVAKFFDPCPLCSNTACHNCGRKFDIPELLIIDNSII